MAMGILWGRSGRPAAGVVATHEGAVAIAGEICAVADSEAALVQGQVDQVRDILRDAVGTLQSSFREMEAASQEQERRISALMRGLTLSASEAAGGEALSIQAFVRETSVTLQSFCDLIAGTSKRSIDAVYKIDDVAAHIESILKLLGSIDNVAEETSMLAINASLEAARTGAAGKGFAIVASEVRNLSRSVKKLSGDISGEIAATRSSVQSVRGIMVEMAKHDMTIALSSKGNVDRMLAQMQGLDEVIQSGLSGVSESQAHVAAAVATAVRCLQFEDITTQLLAAIGTRLTRLCTAFASARNALAETPVAALLSQAAHSARLSEVGQLVASMRERWSAETHVQVGQSSMSQGEVELF